MWVWERLFIGHLKWINEVFSTGDLLRTLFAPFRQTYAGKIRGPIGEQFRAFADRSISRVIGAIVRLGLVFCALILSVGTIIFASLTLLVWPLLPLLPIISVILMVMRVGL